MKKIEDSENKRLFREAESLRAALRAELRSKATNSINNVDYIKRVTEQHMAITNNSDSGDGE